MLGKKDLVRLLQDMIAVRTENPPGNEKTLAILLHTKLKEQGIPALVESVAPRRANLVARIEGAKPGPTLMLNGHLDTVPARDAWKHAPFSGEVDEGKLFGRGAADMKGAIAAMVGAFTRARAESHRLKGTLVLGLVADEERTSLGTKVLLRHDLPDFVVIGEPTDLMPVVSNRGTLRMRVRTSGVSGHCSNPREGTNAIYSMARVVARLEEYAAEISAGRGRYTEKPSLSVTVISGGTAENVIPDSCEITVDRRLIPGETADVAWGELVGVLESTRGKNTDRAYNYEVIDSMIPWRVREDSLLLRCCRSVYRDYFRRSARARDLGGSSEAGLFAQKGIDTLIFGPGSIREAHQVDECIEVEHLEMSQDFYFRLIRAMLV